jgi:cytochrome c6
MTSYRTFVAVSFLLAGFVAVPAILAAEEGADVYKAKCAKCHGDTGKGDTPTGKSMKVPSLVGDEKVLQGSEESLIRAIRENKKHKEPIKKATDAELKAVIPYLKKLAGGS